MQCETWFYTDICILSTSISCLLAMNYQTRIDIPACLIVETEEGELAVYCLNGCIAINWISRRCDVIYFGIHCNTLRTHFMDVNGQFCWTLVSFDSVILYLCSVLCAGLEINSYFHLSTKSDMLQSCLLSDGSPQGNVTSSSWIWLVSDQLTSINFGPWYDLACVLYILNQIWKLTYI